jgi:hypothetical protein
MARPLLTRSTDKLDDRGGCVEALGDDAIDQSIARSCGSGER